MNKTMLVLRQEIVTILSRPSFLFVLFGIPIIGALVFAVAGQLNKNSQAQSVLSQIVSSPQSNLPEGYVDESSILKEIPSSVPAGTFIAFPSEVGAQQALVRGEISAYYIVSPDYIQTGKITYVQTNFNPLGSSGKSGLFEWILRVNLLGGDTQVASLVNGPLNLEKVSESP